MALCEANRTKHKYFFFVKCIICAYCDRGKENIFLSLSFLKNELNSPFVKFTQGNNPRQKCSSCSLFSYLFYFS